MGKGGFSLDPSIINFFFPEIIDLISNQVNGE